MFFDKLAKIAEQQLPHLLPTVQQARLFRFERTEQPVEDIRKSESFFASWEPDARTVENFRLPFPVIAIECTNGRSGQSDGCIVLSEQDSTSRTIDYVAASKTDCQYTVAVVTGTFKALPDVNESLENPDRLFVPITMAKAWECNHKAHGPRTFAVDTGWEKPELEAADENLSVEAQIDLRLRNLRKLWGNSIGHHCRISMGCLLVICDPARFIVEERPTAIPKQHPDHKVTRSIGREHYIVLLPREIRTRLLGEAESTDKKVSPHERRGHHRTMRSERFKNARGRTIWIEPMWIGPTEAVRGKNKYKVRLDL